MAEQISSEFRQKLEAIILIPASGGCFEVSIDESLVFSKLAQKRFPEWDEIKKFIQEALNS